MSRLGPAGRGDVSPAARVFARVAGRVMGTEPPAVFLTLARTRGLFWGWLHFAGRLMPGGTLPRRESELVILRVASVRSSAYELAHHRHLGRRAGLTRAEVERVAAGPDAEGWGRRDRLLLVATDELLADDDLSEATWRAVHAELGDRTTVELLLLVGHYRMLATTLHTLRVAPDVPRRGRRGGDD